MRTVSLSASRCLLECLRSDVKTVQLFHIPKIADRVLTTRLFSSGAPDFGKIDTSNIKFTKRHEWISRKDGRVGVTHYAQDALGDIVYAKGPDIGLKVKRYDVCGALESVKAASEIYAPLDGSLCFSDFNEVSLVVGAAPIFFSFH